MTFASKSSLSGNQNRTEQRSARPRPRDKRTRILKCWTIGLLLAALVPTTAGRAQAGMLVTSYNSNQVLRYNQATGAFVGVAASGGGLSGPDYVTLGPDGNL